MSVVSKKQWPVEASRLARREPVQGWMPSKGMTVVGPRWLKLKARQLKLKAGRNHEV